MTTPTNADRDRAREVGKTVDRCLYRGFEDEVYAAYAQAIADTRATTREEVVREIVEWVSQMQVEANAATGEVLRLFGGGPDANWLGGQEAGISSIVSHIRSRFGQKETNDDR